MLLISGKMSWEFFLKKLNAEIISKIFFFWFFKILSREFNFLVLNFFFIREVNYPGKHFGKSIFSEKGSSFPRIKYPEININSYKINTKNFYKNYLKKELHPSLCPTWLWEHNHIGNITIWNGLLKIYYCVRRAFLKDQLMKIIIVSSIIE